MRNDRQVVELDATDMATVSISRAGVLDGGVVDDDDWHAVVDAEGE